MGVRLGIRGQLLAAVGVVLIGVAAVGLAGWRYTTTLATEYTDLYQNNLQAAVQLADAQDALWRLRYGFPQFLVLGAEDRRKIVAEEPSGSSASTTASRRTRRACAPRRSSRRYGSGRQSPRSTATRARDGSSSSWRDS